MPQMLSNIIRNLVRGPVTRRYPKTKRTAFPGVRGEIVVFEDRCCYCGMCSRGCPANAISMTGSRKNGDITLGYNPFACIYCGKCVEMCPCCALVMYEDQAPPRYKMERKYRENTPV
ncbi:MAG: 4Fe-4S binding protein [Peptococcaceae bacterium]|nr:4Fe-4S binding protein [Peptococcaceae bacterium]